MERLKSWAGRILFVDIILLDKGMKGLDACLKQVKEVFIDSVLRFKPLLKDKPYRPMVEADVDKELKEAVGNPDKHAIFIGVEGDKQVVAISHVMFGGEIPKGQVLVRWIGACRSDSKREYADKRNLLVDLLAKKHTESGRGSMLIEHIARHYKNGYGLICTELPEENKQAKAFFFKHRFKKADCSKKGFVRLERKL